STARSAAASSCATDRARPMLLWFAGGSVLIVFLVFRSPAVDYRRVGLGALLPLAELLFGSPRVLHSITGAAVVLGAAMVITPRRRLVQRRLVAGPIGMFLPLLLGGLGSRTPGVRVAVRRPGLERQPPARAVPGRPRPAARAGGGGDAVVVLAPLPPRR